MFKVTSKFTLLDLLSSGSVQSPQTSSVCISVCLIILVVKFWVQ